MELYIERAKGVWLYGQNNEKYLDACAGTFNIILGHGEERVMDAVQEQLGKMVQYSSSWKSHLVEDFSANLLSISPKNLDSCFCKVTGGSTANEVAIRMLAKNLNRKKVILMEGSHHGNTIFLSNNQSVLNENNKIFVKMPKLSFPSMSSMNDSAWAKSAADLDFLFKKHSKEAACFIIEPIQGRGGNLVPPKSFFKTVSESASRYSIPIIADEVQVGVGRTGKFFGSEAVGLLQPDVIVLAKGITGCGFPLGVILYDSTYGKLESAKDGFTFGSNLVSVAAAKKTVEIVSDPKFLQEIQFKGEYLRAKLEKLQLEHNSLEDIRGIGLFFGIKLKSGKEFPSTERMIAVLAKNGVICRSSENVLKIRPPLVITLEQIDFLCKSLEVALNETERKTKLANGILAHG
ncbi:MAG: aspartate aminotransferase family protein [Candidatus Diapherotrites archaeon]|nr:aspartate aminotransferase family protein [Candidatus Diapherotrites archaeon]